METIGGMNVWQLIAIGGPMMWPILLCSVVAAGTIINKLKYFSRIQTDARSLKNKVFELIKENKIKEAVELCDANPSPVAGILKGGVLKFGCAREEIKEALQEVSLLEIPKLEKGLNLLATIANITPLLGLLGTALGMIVTFYTIQVRTASMDPATPGDLAGGIWQALLTTVAGLVVAIPTFAAYNYCVSRVSSFVLEMERAATELVNFLCQMSESTITNLD